MQSSSHLPLTGIRVIEIGQALAGPLAGAILADLGADVIKVEKPDGGDDARHWGPPFGPDGVTSLYFYGINRNKRSITLDLKNPEDVAKLDALCETADVLIQNLRPGVTEKLGIDAATMCGRHPQLIYCNISSYGRVGPLRHHPGFDPLLQAYGGMMDMTGRPNEEPNFCGASINDKATGMFCVIGTLAALHQRAATGKGSIIDTSLFESAVHWVEGPLSTYFATGKAPTRHGTGGITIVPYQAFRAADHPFVIAAGNDRMFAACAKVLGHAEWASDPRFATAAKRVENKHTLIAAMQEAVSQKPRDTWIAEFEKADVPVAAVNSIEQLARTPQLEAIDILQDLPESGVTIVGLPLSINGVRPKSQRNAPMPGQHNDEIFARKTVAQ